jgi:hypothetical protein
MVRRFVLVAALLACVSPAGHAQSPERVAGPTIDDLIGIVELGTVHGGLSVSPDGEYVALIERRANLIRNDYDHAVILVPTRGGSPRTIADAGGFIHSAPDGRRTGGPADRTPAWSPDSQWVAFIAEREGKVELWRAHIGGARTERVTELDGDVTNVVWLADGRFLVDLEVPRATLAQMNQRDSAFGYRVDDRLSPIFSLNRMPSGDVRTVLVYPAGLIQPIETAERTALMAAANAHLPVIGPQTGALPVQSPPRQLRLDHGRQNWRCSNELCQGDIRNPVLLANGHVAFLRVSGFARTETGVHIWNPETGEVRQVRLNEDRLTCAGGREIYCLRESTWRPRELIAVNPGNGATRVLYDANPSWSRFPRTGAGSSLMHTLSTRRGIDADGATPLSSCNIVRADFCEVGPEAITRSILTRPVAISS